MALYKYSSFPLFLNADSSADGSGRLQQHHTRHPLSAGLLSQAAQSGGGAVQHAQGHGRRHQSHARRPLASAPGTSSRQTPTSIAAVADDDDDDDDDDMSILMCAQKLTDASLSYRTEPETKNR